ncbi:phage major capsid protein [Brevibacillus sp. DP1.3A]|uniref:phage major capsid protein n=1 Tax=Brevibacillus sp. DP1.3A TaxID=2738867 RepID=UPI00156A99E4|nr:phage major capsid protein [Brevibacillus sp. DP1.3A]UED78044.1 phage major capsid protein [Brevibacillus sp. DP1.3A]
MKKTLYELKQNLVTIGQQLQKTEYDLAAKAIDPSASMEEIQTLQRSKEDLKTRFDVVKQQHDTLEAEQLAKLHTDKNLQALTDPAQQKMAAKAELVRGTIRQQAVSTEALQILGDKNNTGGEKFLPKTMTNDLLHEPFVKNPLRGNSTVTSVTNLEIPKITFTLDDDNFIADTETAKELKADGDVVSFGRFKFKVKVPISETILAATDTNLVQTVDQALESGLAAKEKKVAFTKTPKTGEEHMSFYSTVNGIKEVTAANKFKSIKLAIADLHEDYRENAKIVMTFADYMEIVETLANGNATLYSAQPEQILGKPAIFCDSATDPIVGDFRFSHFNFDPQMIYDRDKDVNTGVELFVLTAWFDHKIKLKSAFRIAKVVAIP